MATSESNYPVMTSVSQIDNVTKQVAVHLNCFWKGCKLYLQMWSVCMDGLQYLVFEQWHYNKQQMTVNLLSKLHTLLMFLSGYRYGHNRGRHWDRKRKR